MPPAPSKSSRFDPLALLLEIQADSSSSGPSKAQDADSDDDFMSDRLIPTTETKQPLTYTDKRRKIEAHHKGKERSKSLKQREEEAREEGLDRDLLAEAEIVAGGGRLPPEGKSGGRRWDLMERSAVADESAGREERDDGTAKAMRMMLAMGYRRGEALGKPRQEAASHAHGQGQEEEEVEESEDEISTETGADAVQKNDAVSAAALCSPPETDPESLDTDEERALDNDRKASQAREQDEYLTGSTSALPLANEKSFAGAQTEPLRPDQRWLGPHRRAGIGMIPKTSPDIHAAILAKTSHHPPSTFERESDFRSRISRQHQQRHDFALLLRARKTLLQLDQASGTQYNPLWLDGELYHVLSGHTVPSDAATIDEKMQKDAAFKEAVELLQWVFGSEDEERINEATAFVGLQTRAQLELLLQGLRAKHSYCLFCGCQYDTKQELEECCPGLEEDDHD